MLGGQNFGGILFSKGGKLVASWFASDEIKGVKNWGHPSFFGKRKKWWHPLLVYR